MSRRIVYENPSELIQWAAEHIETGMHFRPDAKAIGLADDTGLRAVVVYDCFSAVDCNMHIASDGSKRWMTKQLLITAFAHPFIQWGLNRVTGLVSKSNKAALSFDLHLGFKVEGVCREAATNGDDVVVLGMLKSECRFIKGLKR